MIRLSQMKTTVVSESSVAECGRNRNSYNSISDPSPTQRRQRYVPEGNLVAVNFSKFIKISDCDTVFRAALFQSYVLCENQRLLFISSQETGVC